MQLGRPAYRGGLYQGLAGQRSAKSGGRLPSRITIHPVNPNYDVAVKDLKVDVLGLSRALDDSMVTNTNGSVTCRPNPKMSRAERMERGRKYMQEKQARREALAKMPE
jgi:hypothetical protein